MEMSLELFINKTKLLEYIRNEVKDDVGEISKESIENKKKSNKVNKTIAKIKSNLLRQLNSIVKKEKLSKKQNLDSLLLLNYCCYVVMLEARNSVWKYDYMTFSRRIGELWEPFAKLPFQIPLKNIELVKPKLFSEFQDEFIKKVNNYINTLNIGELEKENIINYFNVVWSFVDSGSIQLELDLHFKYEDSIYNVDYKSGFSSNEKGNTNRLLTVGSILKIIDGKNRQVIFVRQDEKDNNHYLQTLKNSGIFKVYCGDEAYDKIFEFTGYNIKQWIKHNINWKNDISDEFYEYLKQNNLLKYLKW
ncbi:hypothetical protein CF055_08735 [Clostridium botulinum]